ncbi:MAG TPA: DUF4153 domain-containing protein [Longimicrobiales bacterium]|nr:DUF4153 domain-containing protein [Longimicrobiales bacterium]
MTTSLTTRAGRYLSDALRGVRRAPVEVIATLVVAAMFSWALESGAGDAAFQAWAEIAVPCALLLVVAWTGTLLHATGRWDAVRRWAFTIGGALVVGIYAWTVVDFRYEAEAWRAALLAAAAVTWLVALPAFAGRGDDGAERVARMRRVDGRFALRVIGAVLYGAALFIGLALALAAVGNLFELRLDEQIFLHVWGWIAFVLIPWIVLGGLEDYARIAAEPGPTGTVAVPGPTETAAAAVGTERLPAAGTSAVTAAGVPSSGVASVVYRIALWLVPPLLALYTLILYAYVVRILVTGEIPKNMVSPMLLAAGGLTALALLLFDPRPGRGMLARWLRLAPALFIPLAPLGFWVLLMRIDQYGSTEFRVVRVVVLSALVALAIGATVQLWRRRAFSLHAVPLVLTGAFLLSAVGPWSAMSISKRSQESRLATALTGVGIAADAVGADAAGPEDADSSRIVPAAAYEQIRESARYLALHFGPDALPAGLAAFANEQPGRVDYAARLGLRPDAVTAHEGLAIGGTLGRQAPVEIGGGTAYRISWTRGPHGAERPEGVVAPDDRSAVGVALRQGMHLELVVDSRLLMADLSPLMREIERTADPRGLDQLPPEHALVPLADAAGNPAGELVVWSLRADADSTGWRLQRAEGLAVVR